jgi:hypothetical protein
MSKKLYSFDDHPEHRAELKPWADKWIANALSTAAMTDDDRELVTAAVFGLYDAAKLPAPKHVVFSASPISANISAGVAAGVWYLREHPEKHLQLFGRKLSEDELMASIAPACAFIVDCGWHYLETLQTPPAGKVKIRVATHVATRVATHVATRDATHVATRGATHDATRDATRVATHDATRDATRDATHDATRDATRDATHDATRDATDVATDVATDDATDDATHDATHDATRGATHDATRDATRDATDDATRGDLIHFLALCANRAWYMRDGGNQWSGWSARISFFRHVAKLEIDYSKWQHYELCAERSGPRFMHPKFSIVSDRPEILKIDERNRPHCSDGPSHLWRDGWALHFWHGVRVPKRLIEAPDSYTKEEILALNNTEQRRALAERLGWDRYLEKIGGTKVDLWTDPASKLGYELIELSETKERIIRKQSPELKDGSQPWYAEPVHRELKTAQAARKWQAITPFHRDAREAALECNKNPKLSYQVEA